MLSERSDYANTFDSTLWDWLIKGDPQKVYDNSLNVFKFKISSQTSDRLHYSISGTGGRRGRRLACSNKGYVGMYTSADAINILKLEPLQWDGRQLRCRWRDHHGQRVTVGEYPGGPKYLSAQGGYLDHLNVLAEGDCQFLVTPIG